MKTNGTKRSEFNARQVADVQPGVCDPVYGCPPPVEVVCIVTEKVYDECKSIQVNEDEFIYLALPECPVQEVVCLSAELLAEPVCEVPIPGRIRVTFTYRVKIRLFFDSVIPPVDLQKDVTVIKLFNVARAGEEGLQVQCYVPFIECLDAFVRAEELVLGKLNTTIIACVGKYILIKLKARVQLLIPAYGFCPEPPDCDEVVGLCPDYRPEWPPFPPQDR